MISDVRKAADISAVSQDSADVSAVCQDSDDSETAVLETVPNKRSARNRADTVLLATPTLPRQ
jgi:hypothetical protein